MHQFLEHHSPLAFAHRGGAGVHPENTMPAFAHAVDLGYRYVETDVHVTRDGVLLAFHDDDLSRTCAVDVKISEISFAESRSLKVNGTAEIPTLEELFSTWNDLRINVDCKSDAALPHLERFLASSAIRERVCVGSFSDKRLRALRTAYGATICTSMGPREVAQARLSSLVAKATSRSAADAAQVPLRQGPLALVDRRFIDFCHSSNKHVHVWTIDDPDTMHQLLDLGVDGIMTDQPAVLRQVLIDRGEW